MLLPTPPPFARSIRSSQLGLVIFFDRNESLKSYVILQPQWLMDQICYVIRDFRRHRLGRYQRIQKHYFKEWKDLTRYGIISSRILPKLWVELEEEEIAFMCNLMKKIGLLVELNEADEGTTAKVLRYFAPNIIMTEDDGQFIVNELDAEGVDNTAGEDTTDSSSFQITSSMDSHSFMPNGFLERVVA